MATSSKKIIADAHTNTLNSGGTAIDALRLAQKLAMIAPEFHATNNKVDTGAVRSEPIAPAIQSRCQEGGLSKPSWW
jgi:hypothetical protein